MDYGELSPLVSTRSQTVSGVAPSDGNVTLFSPETQRVVLRPFLPAENGTATPRESRIDHIVDRVLTLEAAISTANCAVCCKA